MGLVIVVSTLSAYAIGARYVEDPQIVALLVLSGAAILFIIAAIITQSFERLAEATKMKSEFVSVVSHQLRSPLSNLRWAIELLMSGRLGKIEEKQTEYFKILKENSGRMEELVSNLLTVSRIETANLPFKKEEGCLEDLIKELLKEFEPFAKASNVEVKFLPEENLPKVFTDLSQVRLVIENLLDNAIRYIKGGGKVEINLRKRDKNFYFEIKDDGVGIPKDDQKYIFQKFFRSENVLRYQTQGSGLGLYIAKAIIEKSGGKIGFKSRTASEVRKEIYLFDRQEGTGSTFWFILPIRS